MKSITRLISLLVTALVITSISLASSAQQKPHHAYITIVHFNDFHGHIENGAKIAKGIEDIRRENQEKCKTKDEICKVLVLYGGDLISGTIASRLFNGKAETNLLNAIQTSAAVIGNHDFDFGLEALRQNIKDSSFPTLAANIYESVSGARLASPYTVLEEDGIKILVFGLTHKNTPMLTNPKNTEGLVFKDEIKEAREIMNKESEGTDIQIALTHEGVEKDIKLASSVEGLDAVVGGHDHVKPKDYCRMVKEVPVCQTPAYGKYIGRIELELGGGRVIKSEYSLMQVDEIQGVDETIERLMKPYLNAAKKEAKRVVFHLDRDLPHEKGGNSELASAVAASMRSYTKADIGIINTGGIRRGLKKGDVTYGDLYEVLPFDNVVMKLEMKGKDLIDLIEFSKKRGGILVFDGIDAKKIEDQTRYTVATVDFLVNGGDGFTQFKKGSIIENTGTYLRDVFLDYIKKNI